MEIEKKKIAKIIIFNVKLKAFWILKQVTQKSSDYFKKL